MTTADVKAYLAAAYASGEVPRFVSVAPNGRDELWALANVAFVLAVVPPDAPPELEYALRTRRESYLTGKCPDCGATPQMADLQLDGQVPMATSLFPHSIRCPARDESAHQSLQAYYADVLATPAEERLHRASISTRTKIGVPADLAIPMDGEGAKPLTMQILEELYKGGGFCGHLEADPAQTSHVLIAERVWRCDECFLHHVQEIAQTGATLPGDEEFRCDLCRSFDPDLRPLVMRVDHCVMRGGACSSCMTRYASEGGETP